MSKHGRLQTAVEYATTRAVLTALGALPISWSIPVGRRIGRLAYHLASRLRRTGRRNLELAFPEMSESERRVILLECFESLGRELGLFTKFSTGSRDQILSVVEPSGLEHLERAKAGGKGVILFTGHLGGWELNSFGLSLLGYPFTFLVRRIDNPKVEQLVDAARTRFGNQTVDKLAAGRLMVKTLRAGGLLGLLIDLNTLDEEAIFVDFFGVPASTNFMVAKLALRTGSPIIPMFSPWDETKKKFILKLEPPVTFEATGNEDKDIYLLTTKLSMTIEGAIRKYPGQWLWIHRRWKTRPKGEPSLYTE